jgi:hypothetical protein
MTTTINGIDAALLEATCKAAEKLTERDFEVLRGWRPDAEQERREEHRRTIERQVEKQQREGAARLQQPVAPARPYARSLIQADLDDLPKGFGPEELTRWAEKHGHFAAPIWLWHAQLKAARTKREALESRVKQLEARLAEVETRGIRYLGVWQSAQEYKRGDTVTYDGSMWICVWDTTRARPGAADDSQSRAWTLAVRRGRDGRDASGGNER